MFINNHHQEVYKCTFVKNKKRQRVYDRNMKGDNLQGRAAQKLFGKHKDARRKLRLQVWKTRSVCTQKKSSKTTRNWNGPGTPREPPPGGRAAARPAPPQRSPPSPPGRARGKPTATKRARNFAAAGPRAGRGRRGAVASDPGRWRAAPCSGTPARPGRPDLGVGASARPALRSRVPGVSPLPPPRGQRRGSRHRARRRPGSHPSR